MQKPVRQDVVNKAREYVGAPFRHQGRSAKFGIDCVGLPISVGRDLFLTGEPAFDFVEYPKQPANDILLQVIKTALADGWLLQKSVKDMKPGDVVSMSLPRLPTHMGIIVDGKHGLALVHAYDGINRECIEHSLDKAWLDRVRGCYAFAYLGDV